MKKTLAIILILSVILFSGCGYQKNNENLTEVSNSDVFTSLSDKEQTTLESTEESTRHLEQKTEISEVDKTQNSLKYEESPPLDIVSLNISTLKGVKKAAETMSDEDFFRYIQYNYFDAVNCEFDTPEKFLSFLAQIENIYIAVIAGDEESTKSLDYNIGKGWVFQSILLSNSNRFAFNYYVSVEPDFYYSNDESAEHIKAIETESIKANIYKIESREGYCADATIHNQYANFRASEAQTIEEFEADLAKIKFVKIGDLLNETATETTLPEVQITPETDIQITE